jgi:hypothetical protein
MLSYNIVQPDLPYRYLHDIPAIKGSREHYYVPYTTGGYLDYGFAHSN